MRSPIAKTGHRYGYALSLDEAKAAFRAEYLAWKSGAI
jgi:hypothetical protein